MNLGLVLTRERGRRREGEGESRGAERREKGDGRDNRRDTGGGTRIGDKSGTIEERRRSGSELAAEMAGNTGKHKTNNNTGGYR